MEKYALKTEDGFFSYESSHYVCNATFMLGSKIRATTWAPEQTDEILTAMEHARKEGYNPKLVKVTVSYEEVDFDFEEKVRQNALNKLTEDEKRVLGVG